MIIYKNEEEIKLLRVAGRIVALTHEYLKPYIKPGISTKEFKTNSGRLKASINLQLGKYLWNKLDAVL